MIEIMTEVKEVQLKLYNREKNKEHLSLILAFKLNDEIKMTKIFIP